MYFLLHLIVLLVPGLCLVHLMGIRQQRCGIALGLSYLIAIGFIASARVLSMRLDTVVSLWAAVTVILSVTVAVTLWRRKPVQSMFALADGRSVLIATTASVAGAGAIWLLGPYLEVPADVLRHLDNIQRVFSDLRDGAFATDLNAGLAYRARGEYWFYLHCVLTIVSGVSESSALLQASMANTAIAIFVVFGFAQIVFKELDAGPRLAVALIATILFVLFFGINVFAWVRYYALAPAFLALPIYFVVMGMLASVDNERGIRINWLLLAGVLTLSAGLIHRQEALFIYVIGSVFVVALTLRHRSTRSLDLTRSQDLTRSLDLTRSQDRALTMDHPGKWVLPWWLLALSTVALAAAIVIWSHLNFLKNPVVDGEVLELRKHLPTVRDIHILDPSWKFYRTIGAFGLLVYLGLIIWWSRARRHLFLVVAMIAPIFHVFNPIYADAFLRHSSADMFWRLSYTVPITFLGALLLVLAWRGLGDSSRSPIRRLGCAAFLTASLVALVAPSIAGYPTWNRWQTLKPVEKSNSLTHFADLVHAFKSLDPPHRVHTDPVTAYLLMASTQADAYRTKFHRPGVSELDPGYYSDQKLAELDGHLVVINLRDGAPSETGRRSGHWPGVITATSAYYSREFVEFVTARPDSFRSVWTNDNISLYRIHD